jgi:hypothetical protein
MAQDSDGIHISFNVFARNQDGREVAVGTAEFIQLG